MTSALTSLRGAVKSLQIFSDLAQYSIPSYTTIQNWILQYGLYQLNAPIERRTDWIFILDHTIEFGSQKCLVILGITQEALTLQNGAITHEHVRVLHLEISKQTSGEQIHGVVNTLIQKTGLPVQMVSDGGSDIKKGVRLTCQNNDSIKQTYDITHKCGLILKGMLEHDIRWFRFLEKYTSTKRKCVHSQLSFIAPKKLKDKSRWLNLDTSVDWAIKVLEFGDNITEKIQLPSQDKKKLIRAFNDTFRWVYDFTDSIQKWQSILRIISLARDEIKTNGLRADSLDQFNERLKNMCLTTTLIPDQDIISQLQSFFQEQTKGIEPGKKFLGTSDIIESVFAKYKNFSARTPMKGIGKTVLTIPAFLSTITPEKVADALMLVNVKKVNKWIKDNIGQSIFSLRKKAFASSK